MNATHLKNSANHTSPLIERPQVDSRLRAILSEPSSDGPTPIRVQMNRMTQWILSGLEQPPKASIEQVRLLPREVGPHSNESCSQKTCHHLGICSFVLCLLDFPLVTGRELGPVRQARYKHRNERHHWQPHHLWHSSSQQPRQSHKGRVHPGYDDETIGTESIACFEGHSASD
jgi:hypothetical protein